MDLDPAAVDERIEAGRLLWRCRRGMKELDVLLERFARERYSGASAEEKHAFAQLLDLPDPEIVAYVLGHVTPAQPQFAHLARLITSHQP